MKDKFRPTDKDYRKALAEVVRLRKERDTAVRRLGVMEVELQEIQRTKLPLPVLQEIKVLITTNEGTTCSTWDVVTRTDITPEQWFKQALEQSTGEHYIELMGG